MNDFSLSVRELFSYNFKKLVIYFSTIVLNASKFLTPFYVFKMGRKRKLVFESNTPGKVMKLSELWGHGKQAVQTEDALQEESRPADDVPEIADKPVECERGFSRQNLIKTKLRNRLNTCNLYNLMIISLEGPLANTFNFIEAFRRWSSRKQRTICSV